jgi:glycosyltransferase involved in cell wall biosynthesis
LPPHDAVVVEHPGLAPLIRRRRGERWFLTLHNVGSGTLRQQAELVGGRQRWLNRRYAGHAARLEDRWLREYDTVFSVSDDDAAMLPGPSVVVPNGVDTTVHAPSPVPRAPRIVFVGTLGFLPNVDGVLWFVEQVLPLVRRQVPAVELALVGRLATPEVRGLSRLPGVSVHVDVPDVRPYVAAARVSIVPLRVGTGTRLKALESMAAGRPVVGTTVGLAGLHLETGRHALVADDAETFARDVVRVLTDDALAARLAESGRSFVVARYDWERIAGTFVDAVFGAVDRARPW